MSTARIAWLDSSSGDSEITVAGPSKPAAETQLEDARDRFRRALADAHAAGVSLPLLARTVGLSRQGSPI